VTVAAPGALTVLIAPDSFKGSLTSVEVARALAAGWTRARPNDEILLAPLADGGEGTLIAIEAAGGWEWRDADATDPIGRPIRARWLQSADGARAIVELAAASGLSRLAPSELDPLGASTLGTGEVVRAALDAGVRDITLGIGGSATNDGGAGILRGLGTTVAAMDQPAVVDLAGLDPRLGETRLRIACDVSNPLLGERGAAATYGPQKGATPDDVAELDRRLGRYADALEAATGRRERDTPGAGAAGGTGFGLLCLTDRFASLELVPGIDVVMVAADFDAKLARADLVITGEGRIDAQTAFGKTALGVARRAAAAGVACIAVGGGVEPQGIEALRPLGAVVVPVVERPQTVDEAMAAGPEPLERCGERIARLADLGRQLGASSAS
jgi:glycerate kinase